jgi:hypothetical protein
VEGEAKNLELTIWLEVTALEDGVILLLEVVLLALETDALWEEIEDMVGTGILRVGTVGRKRVLVAGATGVESEGLGIGAGETAGVVPVSNKRVETTWVMTGVFSAEVHVIM